RCVGWDRAVVSVREPVRQWPFGRVHPSSAKISPTRDTQLIPPQNGTARGDVTATHSSGRQNDGPQRADRYPPIAPTTTAGNDSTMAGPSPQSVGPSSNPSAHSVRDASTASDAPASAPRAASNAATRRAPPRRSATGQAAPANTGARW